MKVKEAESESERACDFTDVLHSHSESQDKGEKQSYCLKTHRRVADVHDLEYHSKSETLLYSLNTVACCVFYKDVASLTIY